MSARPTGAYQPMGVPFRACIFFSLEAQVEGKRRGKEEVFMNQVSERGIGADGTGLLPPHPEDLVDEGQCSSGLVKIGKRG